MICAIVVTYHPDDVAALLAELGKQCDDVVVVDNGSGTETQARLREICIQTGATLLALDTNVGIAAAQNRGIDYAREHGADYVLLSDHDSLPSDGMVAVLLEALNEDPSIAATGPLPAEEREGGDELVYVDRGWSPKRATKDELSRPRLDVAFLIASGCLIRMSAIDAIGGMREDLFIDHVDLEWGLRARSAGYRLVAVPSVVLHHSLGDDVVHIPGREQPVHVHAPFRNYYLVRNTVALLREHTFPPKWQVRYTYWVLKYAAFNAFAIDKKRERQKLIVRGFQDGFHGRLGSLGTHQVTH